MQALKSRPESRTKKAHHYVVKLMGCRFVLTAIHEDPQIAWDGIRAGVTEIERIENLISSWKDDSSTGPNKCHVRHRTSYCRKRII